jgi:hypothetical protein
MTALLGSSLEEADSMRSVERLNCEWNAVGKSKKSNITSPGEGERRAMRGFVPQYEIAASLIYDALAAGTLRWIGVADRNARKFDDCVLGLQDRVVGH